MIMGLRGGELDTLFVCDKTKRELARGYNRMVDGDRGLYIEFTSKHLLTPLVPFFMTLTPGAHYIWMTPEWNTDLKVYVQLLKVTYANYLPGMLYVSPANLTAIRKS